MVAGGEGCPGAGTHRGGGRSSGLASRGAVGVLGAGCCLQHPPEAERWEAAGPRAEGFSVQRAAPWIHSPIRDTEAGTCLASATTGAVPRPVLGAQRCGAGVSGGQRGRREHRGSEMNVLILELGLSPPVLFTTRHLGSGRTGKCTHWPWGRSR